MSRIPHLLAVTALATALLPATALATVPPPDPPEDPPVPAPVQLPDLRISPKVAVATETGWNVTYTVRNDGTVASGPFKVTVARSEGSESRTVTETGLEPRASRTKTVSIPRSTCYAAFRVVADSAHAVAEIAELDNERWTVGQASATGCADAPRYKVQALDLKALRTQEAADEPYVAFTTVATGSANVRVSRVLEGMTPGHVSHVGNLGTFLDTFAPAGIGISAQVLENDHLYPIIDDGDPFIAGGILQDGIRSAGPLTDPLNAAGWAASTAPTMVNALDHVESRVDDDAIGSATVGHSAVDLARRLDAPAEFFDQTLALAGGSHAGDAFYYLRVRVTRVQ